MIGGSRNKKKNSSWKLNQALSKNEKHNLDKKNINNRENKFF